MTCNCKGCKYNDNLKFNINIIITLIINKLYFNLNVLSESKVPHCSYLQIYILNL